jgi:hypothetical protein
MGMNIPARKIRVNEVLAVIIGQPKIQFGEFF